MSSINLPGTVYPNNLDDESTLLKVHNISESQLAKPFLVTQDEIFIVADFEHPERWSARGGFIDIEGEGIFYSRSRVTYAPSDTVHTAGSFFVSQLDIANLNEPVMVDGFLPTPENGFNSVTLRNTRYTFTGVIRVGQSDVEIAVRGDGPHGGGSHFAVSRPDIVQVQFCAVDADAGVISISTIDFGWTLKKIWWQAPIIDEFGNPIRRVSAFSGLLRNLHKSSPRDYFLGTIVRGYNVAEHHDLVARALQAIEDFVGVDNTDARHTLDFRLRDTCLEDDDFACPDVSLSVIEQSVEDDGNCPPPRVFNFELKIDGSFNRFGIFFGDGTSNTRELQTSHRYATNARIEPSYFVGNEQCDVSSAFFEVETPQIQSVPDVPAIVCPDIFVPQVVSIPELNLPDFAPLNTTINIVGPSFTFPSVFISIPTFISIPDIVFPDISIIFPTFDTIISISFNPPPLTIIYTISIDGPPQEGPCFQLISCNAGYHHPGYH